MFVGTGHENVKCKYLQGELKGIQISHNKTVIEQIKSETKKKQ